MVGSLKQLFSSIQQGIVSTIEGQRYLHALCTHLKLNPAFEAPIAMLVMTEEGKRSLERYESFMMYTNWIFAKVAAAHLSIEEAAAEVEHEMQRLVPCVGKARGNFFEGTEKCCPCCGEISGRSSYGGI